MLLLDTKCLENSPIRARDKVWSISSRVCLCYLCFYCRLQYGVPLYSEDSDQSIILNVRFTALDPFYIDVEYIGTWTNARRAVFRTAADR